MPTSCTHERCPGKLSTTLGNGPSQHLKHHLQPKTKERCQGMGRQCTECEKGKYLRWDARN